jgi:hypothetical protein
VPDDVASLSAVASDAREGGYIAIIVRVLTVIYNRQRWHLPGGRAETNSTAYVSAVIRAAHGDFIFMSGMPNHPGRRLEIKKRMDVLRHCLGHPVPTDEGNPPSVTEDRQLSQEGPEPELMLRWIGKVSRARIVNKTMFAHVQRFRTTMSQKRLAENFGISTAVPPDHSVGAPANTRQGILSSDPRASVANDPRRCA